MNSISLPCSLMAENVYESHKSIRHIMETTCSGSGHRSTRNIVEAHLVSGRLAFVPRWTEPGDLVAGLELPGRLVFSHDVLSRAFEIIRPITPQKNHAEESLLRKELRRESAPVVHCELLGEFWMDRTGVKPVTWLPLQTESETAAQRLGFRVNWKILAIPLTTPLL
jgi:hypothetical protein